MKILIFCLLLIGMFQNTLCSPEAKEQWQRHAIKKLKSRQQEQISTEKPKNAILFLGDGMGITVTTAARIYRSQSRGLAYQQPFSFETWPHTALVQTHSADAHVTESAAAASALVCGAKIPNDKVALAHHEDALVGLDCLAALALRAGKSVGIVTTTRLTHASPASLYARIHHRWAESKSGDERFQDIAHQLVHDFPGNNLTLVFGGGRAQFEPCIVGNRKSGCRTDNRNLTQEWLEKSNPDHNRVLLTNRQDLESFTMKKGTQVLGLFADNHLDMVLDRSANSTQPTLPELVAAAVKILSQNQQGYFLFVEGGQIDISLHDNKARKSFEELIEFDEAIAATMSLVDLEKTLMVTTADHSHNLNFAGYASKNASVLGYIERNDRTPILDESDKKWTMLSFFDGPSANVSENSSPSETDKEYQQRAMLWRERSSHGGEEVFAYATGPSSATFSGLLQNTDVFYFFCFLLDLPECRKGSWETIEAKQTQETGNKNSILSPLLLLALVLVLASVGLNLIFFVRWRQQRTSMNISA